MGYLIVIHEFVITTAVRINKLIVYVVQVKQSACIMKDTGWSQ